MKQTLTERGFALYEFEDRYGEKCSLQESSLGSEAAIWLGTEGNVLVGPPWRPCPLPPDAMVKSRMHLTQEMVADLLPHLVRFVETGQLVASPEQEGS